MIKLSFLTQNTQYVSDAVAVYISMSFPPIDEPDAISKLEELMDSFVEEAMGKYGILIEKLRTDGNERLENGLTFIVKSIKGYRSLTQFFRDGGIDPWGEKTKDKILMVSPVEQYLISKEKRLFKK